MAVRSSTTGGNQNSTLVIVALIAVIAVAVFLGYRMMPKHETIKPPENANVKYLKKMAVQCQGDINKLDPANRQKVLQISGNYAGMSMQMYYTQHKQGKF